MDTDNNIEYNVKSCQVKMAIVKWKNVRLKGLKFNHSQKEMLVQPKSM